MSARTARLLAAVCALALIGAAPAESMIEQVFRLRTEAAEAAKAGDLKTAQARLESARTLFPTSPGLLIRLARVQAANGQPEAAVATLKAYADLGLVFDVANDPALKDLAARPDFALVATAMKTNAQARGTAELVVTVDRGDFIGEGVAVLPDGDLLLSGVAARAVLRVHEGQLSPFLQGDADTGALFGMALDQDGAVWIAEAWGADLPGGSGPARTGLLKLAPDGRVLARYPLVDDGKPRQLGDVIVDEAGTVYATDSVSGGVYRLRAGEAAPSLFAQSNAIKSPQGMGLCSGALLVADYSSGLYRIDTDDGAVSLVAGQGGAALVGLDGVARDPSEDRRGLRSRVLTLDFIATQNGVEPQRLMGLRLDRGCRKLIWAEARLANMPGIDDLSLGAVGQHHYYFVGHSQWGAWGGEGKPVKDDQPVRLYSVPIF
ncbi:sugar lactone lactonase YvrE [Caulobacter ginsengisoli]|uniref:Sugar lactone lactonase YvrE n=1 Tax=Caulobacter ginsengisoli TaxID=400775 RepID=A0ABU0IN54_9CAUL|nr:tetratricopeptide repeat protein [Caulobacter ginsengisoli]MDQ0463434.1 sugar lactone lactonase YvrE [Caulobacter ginsengisoli]